MSDLTANGPSTGARRWGWQFNTLTERLSRKSLIGLGVLAFSVVLLVTLGALLNINLGHLSTIFSWSQHSDNVLLQAGGLERDLLQIESSARSYSLSGNRLSLDGVSAAQNDVRVRLATLDALVADNPVQVKRLSRLKPMVQARLAHLIWVAKLGQDEGRNFALSNEPPTVQMRRSQRQLSRDIHQGLAEFVGVERWLLRVREMQAQRATEALDYLALFIALLAPACGIAGIYLLLRDEEEQRAREMKLQLMHTQRLSLMGETASMLAHEINQTLTAATNYLGALKRIVASPEGRATDKPVEMSDLALEQIKRGANILRRLRDFIDKRERAREFESPSQIVSDAVSLLGTISEIKLRTTIAPGLPDVVVDRIQLQQVLVNLMRNAIEAMQGCERRELTLIVHRNAGFVEFDLRDTGPGLPRQVSERLFQPFVSTKAEGMGVGLSICQKIILDHGGKIWAAQARGGGTIFSFTVPSVTLSDLN